MQATLRAARNVSARDIVDPPQAKGRPGLPPTMEHFAAAYRSHEILLDGCGGDGSIFVRFEGTSARTHSGAKNDVAQRPKRFIASTVSAVPERAILRRAYDI